MKKAKKQAQIARVRGANEKISQQILFFYFIFQKTLDSFTGERVTIVVEQIIGSEKGVIENMSCRKRFLIVALCLLTLLLTVSLGASAATTSKAVRPEISKITIEDCRVYTSTPGKEVDEIAYSDMKKPTSLKDAGVTQVDITNGSKITITTETSTDFKLYFVVFSAKLTVPANTIFNVDNNNFNVTATRTVSSKSATAATSFELVALGASYDLSNVTFKPATSKTSAGEMIDGASLIRGEKTGKGSALTTAMTYADGDSATIKASHTYKNATDETQDIYAYYGLWVAAQYGSKYENSAQVVCTIAPDSPKTLGKIIIRNDGIGWTSGMDIEVYTGDKEKKFRFNNNNGGRYTSVSDSLALDGSRYYIYMPDYMPDKYGSKQWIGYMDCPDDVGEGGFSKTIDFYSMIYVRGDGFVSGDTPDTEVMLSGDIHTVKGTTLKRGGYTQLGWSTTKDGEIVTTVKATETIRLYPVWKVNDYTITFDPCGGSVSQTSKTVTYTGTYGTLPTPTRPGYKFRGWYTRESGGERVTETSTVSYYGDRTLYAQWNVDHIFHAVCYGTNCTDSSHSEVVSAWAPWTGTDAISYTDNTAYVFMANDITSDITVDEGKTLYLCLSGKNLLGKITVNGTLHLCNCKAAGSVKNESGSAVFVGSTGTLNYYKVMLIGGSGDNVPIYADGTVNLYNIPKITASDSCAYEIRGNSPGFLHICAELDTPSKNVPRVNFGTDPSVSMTTYTQVTVTTGWSDYMSGKTPTDYFVPRTGRYAKIEKDGDELVLRRLRITFDGSSTYYAKYNGGTISSVPGTPGSRSGYTFSGWFTAEAGGTKITTSYVFDDDTTVYSQWTANKYTVTLRPSGGSVSPTTVTVTYDSTYGTLPTPTRQGYSFKGWYTSSSGGTKVDGDTKVTTAGNHILYAQWGPEEVISVEITWGAMEFTYYDGDWNSETHKYENGGWEPNVTNGNRITVRNAGNVSVTVQFDYTKKNTAVSASFSDGTADVTAPVSLPTGTQKQIWLTLSGKPSAPMSGETLGTVTVKIGGKQTS